MKIAASAYNFVVNTLLAVGFLSLSFTIANHYATPSASATAAAITTKAPIAAICNQSRLDVR